MICRLLLCAAVLIPAAPATAHFEPVGADCGFVSFQANTDHGAFSITAAGLTCAVARRVIRSAVKRGDTLGYYCRYRPHDDDLAHRDWRCRKGGARVITFVVS